MKLRMVSWAALGQLLSGCQVVAYFQTSFTHMAMSKAGRETLTLTGRKNFLIKPFPCQQPFPPVLLARGSVHLCSAAEKAEQKHLVVSAAVKGEGEEKRCS